jgi:NAD(P)-dependent dehydrogenase (short-subunit alcohol dehydrogenase family)
MSFSVKDIPDLHDKVAIVTGANSGIGRIVALELARKGAYVILACRSAERAAPVVEEIKRETNNERVEYMHLDLAELSSVKSFAEKFKERNLPLHILVNNAGLMATPFTLTKDGIELQFQINYVGHFYLTNLLLPVIEQSMPSRIVMVSSILYHHTYGYDGMQLEHISDPNWYDPWKAYGESKLCLMLFSKELAKRLGNKPIYVNCIHPGYVNSNGMRNFRVLYGTLGYIVSRVGSFLLADKPSTGALTPLYAATSPEIELKNYRGEFFGPVARLTKAHESATNMKNAEKLWNFTEDLIKSKMQSEA